jgi:hypothetical protein
MKSADNADLEEVRIALIRSLAGYSVRKEMCLPVLLLVGKSEKAMLLLMKFMQEKKPTEDEIILKALELESM